MSLLLLLQSRPAEPPTVGYGLLAFWMGGARADVPTAQQYVYLTAMGVWGPL